MCNVPGVEETGDGSCYLGMPNTTRRNPECHSGFSYGKNKATIQSWEGKIIQEVEKKCS